MPDFEILDYAGGRDPEVAALILGVQRRDVGLFVPIEAQPELLDIATAYRDGRTGRVICPKIFRGARKARDQTMWSWETPAIMTAPISAQPATRANIG